MRICPPVKRQSLYELLCAGKFRVPLLYKLFAKQILVGALHVDHTCIKGGNVRDWKKFELGVRVWDTFEGIAERDFADLLQRKLRRLFLVVQSLVDDVDRSRGSKQYN